jgi:O-antigen ligase
MTLTILLIFVLAPLPFGSNRPWAWSMLALVTGALLVSWAWRSWRSGAQPAVTPGRIRGPLLLFLLVCLYVALQTVPGLPDELANPYWRLPADVLGVEPHNSISIAPTGTTTALMRLLSYGAIFWLALQSFRSVDQADRAVFVIALAGAGYSAYGLLMHFSGAELILWFSKWDHLGSVTGTFANRNHFATFTGLGLLCALAYLARQNSVARTPWAALAAFLLRPRADLFVLLAVLPITLVSLVLSQSRAGVVSTLAACSVFCAGLAWQSRRQRPLWLGFCGAFLASAGLYLALAGDSLFHRIAQLLDPETVEYRFPAWRAILEAIGDFPLLGVGYGAFEDVFKIYRPPEVTVYFDTAHSTYLENSLELGLPAALALWSAMAWVALICLRALRRRHPTRLYAWAAACVTILVGLHAAFDFSLQIPAVALTYAAILGIGCSQSWSPREDTARTAA